MHFAKADARQFFPHGANELFRVHCHSLCVANRAKGAIALEG
jgi:hypothetical protein